MMEEIFKEIAIGKIGRLWGLLKGGDSSFHMRLNIYVEIFS